MNEATAFTLARVLGLVAQDVLTLESVDPVSFNLGQRISINFHYDPVGVAIKVIIPSQSPEEASRNHERDAVEVAQLGQEPQSMCSICFDMKVEGDLLQCSGGGGCGCKFCRCCMEKHVLTSVGNGVIVPRCPGVCCERALHEEEIELYAGGGEEGTKLLRRLASMRESRAVDTDPLASWCPNSLCSSVCRRASKREMRVECSSCTSVFCGSCCQFWEDCSKPHSLRCSGKLRDPRREMSQRREKTGSTRCPCCRIPIELESSIVGNTDEESGRRGALRPVSSPCARLQCPSCKHDFCRHCGDPCPPGGGHFRSLTGCPGLEHSMVNPYGKGKVVRVVVKAAIGIAGVAVAPIALAAAFLVSPMYLVKRLRSRAEYGSTYRRDFYAGRRGS